ncbi:hypothetical protein LP123_05145 [Moraxella bovis]|uniref:Phage antitermination protein Q n=1 Tax=Moraxella bovis TaxID=476 RepID=A0ABY6MB75_MORBO|nr:antiterminator Q family protein [Moraxella bovis]UYZ74925.1 hypothetical protein LP093_09105 [Moraxella bovis]UYZ79147.1 hypothetical protein LP115_04760 [Moraxella bovis]UYZ80272.1 hypothetical protein LP113_09475 [Moraxella bovis]UYZ87628.1 hypothetical protein LP094_04770 [Moraxella bovis]UYZ90363.1 hypothetical protein LP114_04625 [Moraxella bovis]
MNEFHEWGKWSRHNPDRQGYPRPWLEMIMRDNVPSPSARYSITDDRAMAIDKAVCALARYSVLQYQVFCMRYLLDIPEYKIAEMADPRIVANRRNRVKQELDKAGGFIYGFLENNPCFASKD